MVLQWFKHITSIFAFRYYFTNFMYNLAYPMFLFSFLHLKPSFDVHNIYGFKSTYIRAFESLLHCLFVFKCLLSSSHLLTSDISLLSSFAFIYCFCPFSLYQFFPYCLHMLSHSFIYISTFSL